MLSESLVWRSLARPRLLMHGGPLAVSRLVVSVGVDPVECVLARRARPHVREELTEIIHPFLTNTDAPTAIASVGDVLRAEAPRLHGLPTGIGRVKFGTPITSTMLNARTATGGVLLATEEAALDGACFTAVTHAIPNDTLIPAHGGDCGKGTKAHSSDVLKWLTFSSFKTEAPAGLAVSISKAGTEDGSRLPAITLTHPRSLRPFVWPPFENQKSMKSLPGHVFHLNHDSSIAQVKGVLLGRQHNP